MKRRDWLAQEFERHRSHLRRARREQLAGTWLPEPIVSEAKAGHPERDAVLADSVGLALLVVLETLAPPERLAFVLHDVFAVPFEEIAHVVERSPAATRQLASRARRRIQANAPQPDADLAVQRRVVDAFLAAARSGDFEALLRVLDPDVVLRQDFGDTMRRPMPPIVGAEAVARGALTFSRVAPQAKPAIVNGAAGAIVRFRRRAPIVGGFTVVGGRIVAIDIIGDPAKLGGLDVS